MLNLTLPRAIKTSSALGLLLLLAGGCKTIEFEHKFHLVTELGTEEAQTELFNYLERSTHPPFHEVTITAESIEWIDVHGRSIGGPLAFADILDVDVYENYFVFLLVNQNQIAKKVLFENPVDAVGFANLILSFAATARGESERIALPEAWEAAAKTVVSANDAGTEGVKGPAKQVAEETEKSAGDQPPFTEQTHALIVGISIYQHGDFEPLKTAMADAEALGDFLKSPEGGNISSKRVQILADNEATKTKILSQIAKMGLETNEGDLFIVYFAGHGYAKTGEESAHFLVPYDGQRNLPETTCISRTELAETLSRVKAKRQIVLLDSCSASDDLKTRAGDDDQYRSLANGQRIVITSNYGKEFALDGTRQNSQHSPFAEALLKGLKERRADANRDDKITLNELWNYVRFRVVDSTNSRMHPQKFGPSDGGDDEIWIPLNGAR